MADVRHTECPTHAPEEHVFKSDHRSRVWQVGTGEEARVIKQFQYSPLKQRLAALLGVHPAQRERRANRRAQQAGIPVIPIIGHGIDPYPPGIRYWLATPLTGVSLSRRLAQTSNLWARQRLLATYAQAITDLLRVHWCFKDAKPANLIIDDAGQARWIDVGSMCRLRTRRQRTRMLAVIERTLERAGASDAEVHQCLTLIASSEKTAKRRS